jgi:hypothetical protein
MRKIGTGRKVKKSKNTQTLPFYVSKQKTKWRFQTVASSLRIKLKPSSLLMNVFLLLPNLNSRISQESFLSSFFFSFCDRSSFSTISSHSTRKFSLPFSWFPIPIHQAVCVCWRYSDSCVLRANEVKFHYYKWVAASFIFRWRSILLLRRKVPFHQYFARDGVLNCLNLTSDIIYFLFNFSLL